MKATKMVLRAAAALLIVSAPVRAADQTVPGTQLTLKVSNSGRERLSFRSSGSFTIPTPGSADDPRMNGATLQVFNPNTNESFTFNLPKTHWTVSKSGTQYRYKDSALVESGLIRTARISSKSLRASGRKIGITLNEPSQGALAVVLTSGSFRYCARFDDGSIRKDQPGQFNAKRAPAPASCPVVGTTTTTILPVSTTTLTIPVTTTTMGGGTTTTLTIPVTTTTMGGGTTTTLTSPITTTTLTSPITTTTITSPITSTTVTTPVTTSSTSSLITLSSTTTSSPASTTTTIPLSLKFTTDLGTTSCGGAGLSPAPAAPLTGKIFSDDTCSTQTNDLGRGCLYIGGGNGKAIPPGSVPAGATSYFDLNGTNLLASNGTGTLDCTKAAGPAKYCLNNDALPSCTLDANCGGLTAACHEVANCYFGPPLEFPNPILTSLSTCAVNVIQTDASGTGNASTGDSSVDLPLSSWVYVTGNVTHPCPHCVSNLCEYGVNGGGACSTIVSSETSQDCPPTRGGGAFQAPLTVELNPLSSGTTSLTDSGGNFCPSQKTAGAFGVGGARCIETTGNPSGDLTDGMPHSGGIIAAAFCIPTTTNFTIDGVADLPGPGLTSLPGTAQLVPTP